MFIYKIHEGCQPPAKEFSELYDILSHMEKNKRILLPTYLELYYFDEDTKEITKL